MSFDTFVSDLSATVVGGAILTFLFFLVREKVFAPPNIVGKWNFEMCTRESSYRPYVGMILRYEAIIWRDGNKIYGSVEKVYEDSSTGKRVYIGSKRTRGVVDGYINKKLFSPDEIFIYISEDGVARKSATCHILTVVGLDMKGKFESMVASQSGVVRWARDSF